MTFYCPKCWHEIPQQLERCPSCGYDLVAHEALSYEDKMIFALAHPIRENQMIAIQALGDARYQKALPQLAKLMREAEDYYVLRETLLTLSKLDTAESWALIEQGTEHPSRLVRDFAKGLVAKESAGGR